MMIAVLSGKNVMKTHETERDEQAERRFGAVRGGTQRIQAEDGNASAGADLLGTFVTGRERFADEKVEDVHEE